MGNSSVFITGADGGLGQALCELFAQSGWTVFGGCLSPEKASPHMKERISIVPLDVRSIDSVRSAAGHVQAETDSLDMLINNAGINPSKDTPLEQVDFSVVTEVLNVNAVGPLRAAQQFLPLLKKGRMKRIVNVSSEAGSIADCTRTAWFGYCMSKAGLNIQTKLLRNYLGAEGFEVLAVHPGWMRSGMGAAEATYSPIESAEQLYPHITGPRSPDMPWYFQFDGSPLRY